MAKETNFPHPPQGHFGLLAWDDTNKRWQVVHVDASGNLQVDVVASGLPSDAATATNQATALTELQQKLETSDLTLDGTKDLQVDVKTAPVTEVTAEGGDVVFNFESVVSARSFDETASTGDNTITLTDVPSGKIWVITVIMAVNTTNAITAIEVNAVHDGNARMVSGELAPPAGKRHTWNGRLYLDAADYVEVLFTGCTLNDNIYVDIWGYQMDAP